MKDTVCAVVVTYNRKQLLMECLESLRKQTRPVQGIYLIDNASTDGTPDLLLEKGYINELPPKSLNEPWEKEFEIKNLTDGNPIRLHYVRMHENTGGAGGFHEGVKRAYEKRYDWLWLMDDDVEPVPNAIEILFNYTYISRCIHPRKVYEDGNKFFWEYDIISRFPKEIDMKNISFEVYGKKWICVNYGCFEGMFIHRDIVSKIGFPDRIFFMVGDDTLYGFKANLYTNVIYINEILLIRKKTGSNYNKKKRKKLIIYLNTRNKILLYKEINKLIKGYIPLSRFVFNLSRIILKQTLRFILKFNFVRLYWLYKGLLDGLMNKFDKRVL